MPSEFLQVAERLLDLERRPMTPKQIWEIGKRQGLFSDKIAGKTPYQTLKSKLSCHVRSKKGASVFVRTRAGHFYLRRLMSPNEPIYIAPPFVPPAPSERVLSIPTSLLDQLGRFQGITKTWKRLAKRLLDLKQCCYHNRLDAEGNDSYKQILTYGMVVRGKEVLSFKRGTYNLTEEYLRGSLCIGFGGHVTSDDYDLFHMDDLGVKANFARELGEELTLPRADEQRLSNGEGVELIGMLNDDSSPVGRRHLAFLFRYDVSDDPHWDNPTRGEESITQLKWLDTSRTPFPLAKLEYWSQLCMRTFNRDTIRAQNSYLLRRVKPLRPPNLLCVVGPIGSGKTETSSVLCRDYGYEQINSGQILADLIGVAPVSDSSRRYFQERAQSFISTPSGPSILAEALWSAASKVSTKKVLIDGIRHKATLAQLRLQASGRRIGTIYVHTAPDLAFKFYSDRAGQAITIGDFLALREAPVEKEVSSLISDADVVIYNWEDRPTYRQTVKQIMHEVAAS